MAVSKQAFRRALLYLQAIFTEAERRGWNVELSRGYESTGVAIAVGGHSYPVSMHELHEREPMTDDDIARWRRSKEWELRRDPGLEPPTLKSLPLRGRAADSCISNAERGSPKYEWPALRWLVRYLSEGTPSLKDVAKVTAGIARLRSGSRWHPRARAERPSVSRSQMSSLRGRKNLSGGPASRGE